MALLLCALAPAVAQDAEFASIASVAEFRQAVDAQAQHIVLQSHLDLSREQLVAGQSWLFSLQGVQSIRVCCCFSSVPRSCLHASHLAMHRNSDQGTLHSHVLSGCYEQPSKTWYAGT